MFRKEKRFAIALSVLLIALACAPVPMSAPATTEGGVGNGGLCRADLAPFPFTLFISGRDPQGLGLGEQPSLDCMVCALSDYVYVLRQTRQQVVFASRVNDTSRLTFDGTFIQFQSMEELKLYISTNLRIPGTRLTRVTIPGGEGFRYIDPNTDDQYWWVMSFDSASQRYETITLTYIVGPANGHDPLGDVLTNFSLQNL
jgi:hypothetical protein